MDESPSLRDAVAQARRLQSVVQALRLDKIGTGNRAETAKLGGAIAQLDEIIIDVELDLAAVPVVAPEQASPDVAADSPADVVAPRNAAGRHDQARPAPTAVRTGAPKRRAIGTANEPAPPQASSAARSISQRINKVHISRSGTMVALGMLHKRGLPPFDRLVGPDYSPVAHPVYGAHGVFVWHRRVFTALLLEPFEQNYWAVINYVDCADDEELLTTVKGLIHLPR